MRCSGAIALLVASALVVAGCRRAEGVAEDPVNREAEEALVAYLRIDTTNPPGNETAGASFLRDLLVKEGIEARLVGQNPARQGVYARLASGRDGNALLLLSHIDVVPADAALWRNPPFEGKREGGYIWGRGAIDAKSLTIAHLSAFVQLKRSGAKLTRDVVFLATPDEELGGLNGVYSLLERQPELFRGVQFVLNEGGSLETAVDRVHVWGIEVQQKVPLWLRVVSEGRPGHGATADERGAPSKLVRALGAIDALETPYRLTGSVRDTAAAGLAVRRGGRGRALALVREPLDAARIEREAPSLVPLLRDTITITRIEAGRAVNTVPSRAFADVDIRLLPGTDPAAMRVRVDEAVGSNGRVEVLLEGRPTDASPATGELWNVLANAMAAAEPGSVVAPMVGAGTSDSRFFRERGIVAYGVTPFKVNYYDLDSIHGEDERIRARFFAEGVRLMRTIVRDFCTER